MIQIVTYAIGIDILTEYINNVFSDSDLKHFIIVTHPLMII